MMDYDQKQTAADLLWEHWQSGQRLPALPIHLRPESRAEGYEIQALLEHRTAKPLFGWKIAATSGAGQAHIGVDGPLAGRLLAERAYPSAALLRLGRNAMRVAEPEFAFRMAGDLAPREQPYRVDEVLKAVGTLHPAIEIPDSRYKDFARVGAAQLIADDACAHEFIIGPAAGAEWRSLDLASHPVRAWVLENPERQGVGANVVGDPCVALTWLVNELSSLQITLRSEQIVTTGTCMTPLPIAPGDTAWADFGVLGTVNVSFARE
jgi:2-keto-4-pentenoate hydratase